MTICREDQVIRVNARMRADLNIKSGLKKNADQENYSSWNEMKHEAIFYRLKICVR